MAKTLADSLAATPASAKAEAFEPLICAAEMYPALERLCLAAERSVHLAFRVFDAATELHSEEATALGLSTWAELIAHVCERGVDVRLLLTDFDPIFCTTLHRDAWRSVRLFEKAAPTAQIRCALHGQMLGGAWKTAFAPFIRRRLAELPEDEIDTPLLKAAKQGDWELQPVTLHQKFAVIDGAEAILGGIDVDQRRWDSAEHDCEPCQTWHDVSLQVDGPICDAIERHFEDCWRAAKGGRDETPAATVEHAQPQRSGSNSRSLTLHRTVSEPRRGRLAFAPRTVRNEIEEAHLEAFRRARRSIYIETQFFRHRPIAEALAEAAAREPELQLIMLMPAEPERIAFEGDKDLMARHEQALQHRCVQICRDAFGERFVPLAPAKPETAENNGDRGLLSAGLVYVHSKVTIVDDRLAIVGSANLNGRSLRWDTEAALQTNDPAHVSSLRRRIARLWLGDDAQEIEQAATWREKALVNAARKPEERDGFLLPFPQGRTRRFALYAPLLPDEMF